MALASPLAPLGSTVTIGSVKFTVATTADGIQLTMKENPTAEFTGDMSVTYTPTTASKVAKFGTNSGAPTDSNNAWTDTVRVDQKAIYAPDRRVASGYFELEGVKDGMQIQIGKETYTFAVGADSKFKNASGNIVDLTKVNKTGDDLDKEAVRRLTEVAKNNSMLKVTTDNTSKKVHLTEIDGQID